MSDKRAGRLLVFLAAGACAAAAQTERPRQTMRPVVRGSQYAVSSMKPESSQVAERILRAGGNAFDAIVAGQAVLAIVDAASNGVGSDAVILVYDARSGKVVSINAEGTAPKLATIEWYKQNNNGKLPENDSLLAATVPGVVDAWYLLLDRWGTMTFEQVLAPAIDIAGNGFPLGDRLASGMRSKKLAKYPTSARLYQPNGQAPRAGQVFRNPDLARTLKKLVEAERESAGKGRRAALRAARDRFYKGDIAQAMARFSEENGGLFRYEDFASYTAKFEEPVFSDYRGYRVYKNASATQGPTELFLLNLLEGFDLKSLGHNTEAYIHTSAEAAKLAFADRDKYLGDMDFIRIPFRGLLSKDYALERRKLIDPERASHELRPGVPEKFEGIEPLERPLDVKLAGGADHEGDTSYIGVVDKDRNMVSFTPSLHSGFGAGVVMGDLGFVFNCRGDYYSLVPGHANALAPGKRPRSTLQSTLVTTAEGKPAMIMGSPGGDDQCLRTMQTFLNMVEFGMNVQQAIEAPRWTTRSFPASPFPHTMYPGDLGVENRIAEDVQKALKAKGHKLRVIGAWSQGSNGAIVVDPETGILSAGADPRADAYALAW
jgi:gamma-glutamyltranspeptidase/glutathione hydrolase